MFVDKSDIMFDLLFMNTISDIARAFGSQQKMADAVGATRGAVEQWCQRGTIPSKWLMGVVSAAKSNDIDLTIDRLAEIVAADSENQGAAA